MKADDGMMLSGLQRKKCREGSLRKRHSRLTSCIEGSKAYAWRYPLTPSLSKFVVPLCSLLTTVLICDSTQILVGCVSPVRVYRLSWTAIVFLWHAGGRAVGMEGDGTDSWERLIPRINGIETAI